MVNVFWADCLVFWLAVYLAAWYFTVLAECIWWQQAYGGSRLTLEVGGSRLTLEVGDVGLVYYLKSENNTLVLYIFCILPYTLVLVLRVCSRCILNCR
jgi:hypothetical protein